MASKYPESWRKLSIEDAMEAIIDYRGKSPEKTDHGIPLITAKVVKSGRILEPNEFIATDDYDTWMRRGIPIPGDVVMTTEAPLGEIAQLDQRKVALAQRLITLRGKKGLLDNDFLKYLMLSDFVQHQLQARATGTTVRGIRQSELRKVQVLLPEYQEQKAIAAVLSAFDDKIELNRQMNATLEEIAQTIFKSWFVDFDPIHRNRNGDLSRPYDHLFPDTFEDDRNGVTFPVGWKIAPIKSISELKRDSFRPDQFTDEIFDHYSIPAYDVDQMPIHESGAEIKSNKYIVHGNSVLLSKLNPRIPRIWFPDLKDSSNRSICSTEFLVVVPNNRSSKEFLYSLFISTLFLTKFSKLVTGTSSSHQRVKPKHFEEMKVVVPSKSVMTLFTDTVKPIFEKIAQNRAESLALASLRDALLPKLISGELRVEL